MCSDESYDPNSAKARWGLAPSVPFASLRGPQGDNPLTAYARPCPLTLVLVPLTSPAHALQFPLTLFLPRCPAAPPILLT
jgi:hypothetical protein